MTRPAYHVDVASAAVNNIAQPAGAIQTSGFPANSKFSSANANWLFRRLGEWGRELDQTALRIEHLLDSATPQLVAGNGVSVPTGSGLGPLSPDDGGVYYLSGRLVDLSAAPIATKYAAAWTFSPTSVTYLHARVDPANGGSSYGEILVSANAVEAGYDAIATVITDATDVTSITNLAETRRFVAPRVTFSDSVSFNGGTAETLAGTVLSLNDTLDVNADVDVTASLASTLVNVQQSGAGRALQVNAAGAGTAGHFTASGTGKAMEVVGGNSATAMTIAPGTLQRGLEITGATGVVAAAFTATGAAPALSLTGGGSGLSAALSVNGGGGNTSAISAVGSGNATAITATSGSGAGSVGLTATSGSTTSKAISASGSSTAGATGSHAVYADGNEGVGVEARSDAYYGLLVRGDSTNPPAAPASRWIGQADDPTDLWDGNLFFHSTHKQFRLGVAGYGYRGIMTMGPGSALYAMAHNTGGVTTENTGSWVNAVTAYALDTNGQGYHGAGSVIIRATFEARTLIAGANILNARIKVNGSTVQTRSGAGNSATAGFNLFTTGTTDWQRTICWTIAATPASTGDLTVELEIQRGTANGVQIRDAMLEVIGTF